MSDERVRKLLKEIEDELAGTDRTLADVIRERLRIRPEDETARVRDLIGGRLVMNEPIVHQALGTILHGGATEAALVVAVQALAASLEIAREEHWLPWATRIPPTRVEPITDFTPFPTSLPRERAALSEAIGGILAAQERERRTTVFAPDSPHATVATTPPGAAQAPRDYMTLHDGNRSTPGDDL